MFYAYLYPAGLTAVWAPTGRPYRYLYGFATRRERDAWLAAAWTHAERRAVRRRGTTARERSHLRTT